MGVPALAVPAARNDACSEPPHVPGRTVTGEPMSSSVALGLPDPPERNAHDVTGSCLSCGL
ncbi:hypothetical protein BG842_22265 [Haladaptatus sp. W1]|uniref:hypothetical protein n=1 Tax=Haladaptatus sp. W1 TaxID=1897478 RepID=UPI000849AEA7|nr:hypothetical protein [Haladaptatus sp. W1]ODR83473.1 hypothetical protein BG842_22265 [Haladaptatus sp. W1]